MFLFNLGWNFSFKMSIFRGAHLSLCISLYIFFSGTPGRCFFHTNGGFLKWWYPTIMGFPTKNDHFGVFWGHHHLRKHPNNNFTCWKKPGRPNASETWVVSWNQPWPRWVCEQPEGDNKWLLQWLFPVSPNRWDMVGSVAHNFPNWQYMSGIYNKWRIIQVGTWIIIMVIVSPLRIGLWDPFHMAFLWLENGGYPNQLLTGMILQVLYH